MPPAFATVAFATVTATIVEKIATLFILLLTLFNNFLKTIIRSRIQTNFILFQVLCLIVSKN